MAGTVRAEWLPCQDLTNVKQALSKPSISKIAGAYFDAAVETISNLKDAFVVLSAKF